ncbi:MAG: alpha/beta fold hydrolase [Planctomycetaceae bacterium]|nr:alpha/beta fold hydrolase [Planctomycetaceae bacterium]
MMKHRLFYPVAIVAVLLMVVTTQGQSPDVVPNTLSGVKATYAAPPRHSDGSINMEQLLKELKDIHANTYHWLIAYNDYFGLEYVKRFLPMAARENINVWVTVLPPSEQPALGWSEPHRLDFEKWAEELATLSLEHKNLVAWSVDDFGHNQGFFGPKYLDMFLGKARAINPNFKFVPCIYYSQITEAFVTKYASRIDGVLFPYRAESDKANLKDPSLIGKEIAEIRSRIKREIPVIVDIYASRHSSLGDSTPEYVATALELGMKSADGVTIYCHQSPVTSPEKYRAIGEVFGQRPDLMTFLDEQGKRQKVQTEKDWKERRREILDAMQEVMGPLPDRDNLPPLDVQIIHVQEEKTFVRKTIRFTAAENEFVPAYLYLPLRDGKSVSEKRPAILVPHETSDLGKRSVDGERSVPNRAYARELARRGYVVIAPDYPGFGELQDYDFQSARYASGTMAGIFYHTRCIDLLQSLDEVDPDRIGVIGHSLGGHNAMFVAAFDPRIQVIVASCGWTQFANYDIGPAAIQRYGSRLGPWAQDRYMPLFREKFQLDEKRMPFEFHEVIALFAPRPFFSNSPIHDANFDIVGVRKGIELASQAYAFHHAENNLQVRYPEAEHDFPPDVRLEAYRFIDRVLKFQPDLDDCLMPVNP